MALRAGCAEYEAAMEEVAAQETVSLAERERREEERRAEARRVMKERGRVAREERRLLAVAAAEEKVARQGRLRQDLARQVEEVRERKEREVEERLEEDRRIDREAEKMVEEARRREAEERERLEQFYRRLEAEAEQRERRVEWRMRRSEPGLKGRREEALREQEEAVRRQLRSPRSRDTTVEVLDNTTMLDEQGNVTVARDMEGNIVEEEEATTSRLSILSRDASIVHSDTSLSSPHPTARQIKARLLAGSLGEQFQEEVGEVVTSTPAREVGGDEVEGRRKTSSGVPIEKLLYPLRSAGQGAASLHLLELFLPDIWLMLEFVEFRT